MSLSSGSAGRGISIALRHFSREARGSTSIVFAFCLILLCGSIGGAVDMALYNRAKFAYVEAIDAAALAAGRAKQLGNGDDAAIDAAKAYLAQVNTRYGVDGPVEFRIVDGGTAIEGVAQLSVPSVFLKVLGIKQMHFAVSNKAQFRAPSDVEISLMLDVTGSMDGEKIDQLKAAVEGLIDIVITERADGTKSRIAMAPFSHAVRLKSKHYKEATGEDKGGGGCVVERFGGDAYTDATPGPGRYVTKLADIVGSDCDGGHEIFPLSDKKSDLKAMIRSLSAGGSTAGHLGTAWAWYMLSPQWGALFDTAEMPAPYADVKTVMPGGYMKLRKIAILMTDGEFNTAYSGVDSTTQARALCEEIKKSGIEVFTVGFALGGSPTVLDTLRGCASGPSNFYETENGSGLMSAFTDIALKASQLRLSR